MLTYDFYFLKDSFFKIFFPNHLLTILKFGFQFRCFSKIRQLLSLSLLACLDVLSRSNHSYFQFWITIKLIALITTCATLISLTHFFGHKIFHPLGIVCMILNASDFGAPMAGLVCLSRISLTPKIEIIPLSDIQKLLGSKSEYPMLA